MYLYKSKKVPVTFDDTWRLNRDVRNRELRNVQFTNRSYLKALPLFRFPVIWNNLPADIKALENKNEFNRKVFLHLLLR